MIMRVDIDDKSGFCAGVTGAIRRAETELQVHGQLYCLGDIVHNGQEVKRLEHMGLETIDYDDLRTLRGQRVLLRAHGEPPATYWIAAQNGNTLIDGTCPVVKRLQERIATVYNSHRHDTPRPQIVIFGKRGHAEVIGLCGQTNNTAIVIENPDEAVNLDFTRPIYLFSQTTKDVLDFQRLVEFIAQHISDGTVFEWKDTICRSVANRVEQLRLFAQSHEVVLFVGGEKSSNAKVLFAQCKAANTHTFFLTDSTSLTPDILTTCHNADSVGICGATSTPRWLMEEVKNRLQSF